ncbi:MAG: hypothetical protein GWP17_01025 [Aquificales bacterium]|nr:hypothetical protein [Aquificales bacterium]
MPKTIYTQQNVPTSGQILREQLNAALDNSTALDDFVLLIQELTKLEIRHGMTSQAFWQQFQAGEMGDDIEWMRWANKYEIYLEMHTNMAELFKTLTYYALPTAP